MAVKIDDVLVVLSVVLQLAAAWYGFRVGKRLGNAGFWYLVSLALILIVFRRGLDQASSSGLLSVPSFLSPVLLVVISIFFLGGLYELDRRLQRKGLNGQNERSG